MVGPNLQQILVKMKIYSRIMIVLGQIKKSKKWLIRCSKEKQIIFAVPDKENQCIFNCPTIFKILKPY